MQIVEFKSPTNVRTRIDFLRDDSETTPDFKTAVKAWLAANTTLTWLQFFDRLVEMSENRITINAQGM